MTSVSIGGRTVSLPEPTPLELLAWTAILSLQAALLVTYAVVNGVQIRPFHLYPFVWINLSILVFWNVGAPVVTRRQQIFAGSIAAGYFLILGFFGGLYSWAPLFEQPAEHLRHLEQLGGFELAFDVPPGYGPALFYISPTLNLSISPYVLLGYLALAYLVYVTVLDAATAASSGLLGLFACIGCTWPILASLFGGAGGSTTLLASVYAQAYELSTIAFVLTVALLYWRPLHR